MSVWPQHLETHIHCIVVQLVGALQNNVLKTHEGRQNEALK